MSSIIRRHSLIFAEVVQIYGLETLLFVVSFQPRPSPLYIIQTRTGHALIYSLKINFKSKIMEHHDGE